MMSLRRWTSGSNARSGFLGGLVYGGLQLVWALTQGGGSGDALGAVVSGVIFGVLMGVFTSRMTHDLSGLSRQDRSAVIRAVRLGEAPADVALAQATIRRAQCAQEQVTRRWPWLVLVGFAGVTVLVAVGRAAEGSFGLGNVLFVALWLAVLPILRWQSRRAAARAGHAEAAARRMTQQLPGGG